MKKVPSYPKITSKTNITVTHTQNININSPKPTAMRKGFKNDLKNVKGHNTGLKNQSQNLIKDETKKHIEPMRKNSKKSIKATKDVIAEKSIKNSTSQRELAILSEKLKRLEQKIKKVKEKQKQQKNSSASHRSFSKNKDNHSYVKRDATSSRKQLNYAPKKYFIPRAQSHKVLKKSYSDKFDTEITQSNKLKKKSEGLKNSKMLVHDKPKQAIKRISHEKHDQQILHKFVTQVPNSHPHALKQSVQKSLVNNYYAITPSSSSQDEVEGNQPYYIGKASKSLTRPALFLIREHLVQSLQTLQFLQNVKKPTHKQIQKKQVHLNSSKFNHTVVLDLDQTLIHCNETLNLPHDVKLNIKFPTGQKIDAGVNIRPYAKQFLEELSKICEVIVFTASHECYATVVLDHLDPKRQYISHRLFREHCWQTQEGIYIKDLRVFKNRNLDNVILVDNAAYSYFFQLENGVPIVPYYDDKHDQELVMLMAYIRECISNCEKSNSSLRRVNDKYFRLGDYCKFEDIGPLVEELYSTDNSSLGA